MYSGFVRACCTFSNTSTDSICTGRTENCRLLYGDCKVDNHNLFDTCNPHVLLQLTPIAYALDTRRITGLYIEIAKWMIIIFLILAVLTFFFR